MVFYQIVSILGDEQVAFAHHWLVSMRGGEKVLEAMSDLFPEAPIYTLVQNRSKLSPKILKHKIITSPLQNVPFAKKHFRKMVPLFPWAVKELKVDPKTRWVLSTDSAMIKGISIPDGALHICYCHSPPRYLWDLYDTYTANLNPWVKKAFSLCVPWLREFDVQSSKRVDYFITNSKFTQSYIKQCYGRDSELIYPPVDVEAFEWGHPAGDYDLIVGELTHGKRIDLAVEAYSRMRRKLVIIGEGDAMDYCRSKAGDTVSFLGRVQDIKPHVEGCRAFLFPQIEAFGIAAVEAMAGGKPVLALKAGGAIDIIEEGKSGLFFEEQSVESLIECVERFDKMARDRDWASQCRQRAEFFSAEQFKMRLSNFLKKIQKTSVDRLN